MNFYQRYKAYLRDNPEGYWFKRKVYGWGWVPATWQGWLVLVIFIGLYAWILTSFVSNPTPTNEDTIHFAIHIALWVLALTGICWSTGEAPKWQWGIPEKK
jgi:hypothetical protein